jgi:PAS domain S-box-containing protein
MYDVGAMSKLLSAVRQAFDLGVITTLMICIALLATFLVDQFTQADLRLPLRTLDLICVTTLLLWQFRRIQQHREHDRLFQSIVDAVPHILFYKDEHLRYRQINTAFELAFGVRAEQVAGLRDRDVFGDALHARFYAQDLELLQSGQMRSFEEHMNIQGELRTLQSYKRPLYGATGQPLGIVGLAIDVTEQIRLQQQLRDAHARLNVALQAASMGVWEWDLQNDRLQVDATARSLLHIGEHEQHSAEVVARMMPVDVSRVAQLLQQVRHGRDPVEYEFRIRDASGGEHWVEGFAVAHDSPQKRHHMIGIIRDITERRRSKQALAAAKAQAEHALHALAQSRVDLDMALSAGGLGVWSSAMRLTRDCPLVQPAFLAAAFTADETALAICGFSSGGRLTYQDYLQAIHPDDRDHAVSTMDAIQGDGTHVFRDEYRIVRPDGEIRYLDLRGSVTSQSVDAQHRQVTLTGIVKDITEEEALKADLSAKAEEARQARDAQSRFLAVMSHEVRTPMNGVLGMLDLVIDTPLTAEQHHLLGLCQQSAQGLLTIVNDILDFSKVEAGQLQLESQPVSIRTLVLDVCAEYELQATRKRLALEAQLDDHLPEYILADPLRLRQILTNLISNAIKFTAAGRVYVRTQLRDADTWALEVEDTGTGIAPDALSRLFQPFQQAHTSTSRCYGGTGLGLNIVQQLAELMGGSVQCHSQPGTGSCFGVQLPLRHWNAARALNDQALATAAASAQPSVAESTMPPKHFLLAEDNPVNQEVTKRQVHRLGHTCECAHDGEQAWAMLRTPYAAYDALITDGNMPGLDGYELTQRIRAWERQHLASRLPIILMTANALQGERERCLELGVDAFLPKPTRQPQLQKALARLFGSSDGTPTTEVSRDDQAPAATTLTLERYILLQQACDHRPAIVEQVLSTFIRSTEETLTQMALAHQAHDASQLRRLAHRLGSGCLQLEENAAHWALQRVEDGASDEQALQAYSAAVTAVQGAMTRAKAFLAAAEALRLGPALGDSSLQ